MARPGTPEILTFKDMRGTTTICIGSTYLILDIGANLMGVARGAERYTDRPGTLDWKSANRQELKEHFVEFLAEELSEYFAGFFKS